jgi:malonyl-CoA/methylmalonyl-CoA synthetase
LYPTEEAARLVEQAGAQCVLCEPEYEQRLQQAGVSVVAFAASTEGRALGTKDAASDDEQRVAMLLFTSGTTGRPKAVPFTCKTLMAGVRSIADEWGMSDRDTLVHTLPLHHLHGIGVALLSCLLCGGKVIFVPRFDPATVFDACGSASVLMGVPTQHHRLLEYYDGLDSEHERRRCAANLRGLRLITSGSAKLPESIGQRLEALSGQYPLERYGMTEVGIVISNPLTPPREPGSCGKPMRGVRTRIVDDHGRDVPPGESGELWIAAPTVFAGYDADPGATQAGFEGEFFKTGDTASQTPEGWVHILGRTSVDIIKSGGYKLSALEMEELLRAHPLVADVAVVGVPDERWGEKTVAVVVPTRPGPPSASVQELRTWAKQRTAPYKVPKEIVFREQLPRNALGKVSKHVLLEQLNN